MNAEGKYCLQTHLARFATEQMCHDYIAHVRWQGKPQCPKCGNNHMNYYLAKRKIYKCSNCHKQFSSIQGTIFNRSKLPLTKWFLAIYLFTTKKRGVSSIQLSKWLGVKQHTAWFMLHRLRLALIEENELVLSGVVEGDEAFFGPKIKRDLRLQAARRKHEKEQDRLHGFGKKKTQKIEGKKKRGRKKGSTNAILKEKAIERDNIPYKSYVSHRVPFEKGVVVLGMTERDGKMIMKMLGTSNRCITIENIYPHLQKHISPQSVFISDQLNVYNGTSKLFSEHRSVNHNIAYVIDGVHTNTIENIWKHIKKTIEGTYFHISFHHFGKYLDENTYRWNRRNDSELSIFEDFFPLLDGKQIAYKKLIERPLPKLVA